MNIEQSIEQDFVKVSLRIEVPYEAFALLLGGDSPHLEDRNIGPVALDVVLRKIQLHETVQDMLIQVRGQLSQNLVSAALDLLPGRGGCEQQVQARG